MIAVATIALETMTVGATTAATTMAEVDAVVFCGL